MILAIDPGNIESGWAEIVDYVPIDFGKSPNSDVMLLIDRIGIDDEVVIEMVASYGMAVGQTVFDTCVWIGRFYQEAINRGLKVSLMYRKEVKMNLCNSMRANDSNITQALIDRFAPNTRNKGKGVKADPGWFYGFKKDIWQAYALGITYLDKSIEVIE